MAINMGLTFPARGPRELSFNVPILNDDRVEVDREPFITRFAIPASSPFASSIVALTGQATTEIIDEDSECSVMCRNLNKLITSLSLFISLSLSLPLFLRYHCWFCQSSIFCQ